MNENILREYRDYMQTHLMKWGYNKKLECGIGSHFRKNQWNDIKGYFE